MAEEKKTRQNPDYSGSAVGLTNPSQVKDLLAKYHNEVTQLTVLGEAIDKAIPQELKDQRDTLRKWHQETDKAIHQAIDDFGSYQDIESGEYAVKQRRESVTYKPELTKKVLEPKLASLVIVESVDSKALDGLIKGGLVSATQARECGEVEESFAYLIR